MHIHVPLTDIDFDIPRKREKISGLQENDIECLRQYLGDKIINEAIKKLREFEVLRNRVLHKETIKVKELKILHDLLIDILDILNPPEINRRSEELIELLDLFEEKIEIVEQQIEKLEHALYN